MYVTVAFPLPKYHLTKIVQSLTFILDSLSTHHKVVFRKLTGQKGLVLIRNK